MRQEKMGAELACGDSTPSLEDREEASDLLPVLAISLSL